MPPKRNKGIKRKISSPLEKNQQRRRSSKAICAMDDRASRKPNGGFEPMSKKRKISVELNCPRDSSEGGVRYSINEKPKHKMLSKPSPRLNSDRDKNFKMAERVSWPNTAEKTDRTRNGSGSIGVSRRDRHRSFQFLKSEPSTPLSSPKGKTKTGSTGNIKRSSRISNTFHPTEKRTERVGQNRMRTNCRQQSGSPAVRSAPTTSSKAAFESDKNRESKLHTRGKSNSACVKPLTQPKDRRSEILSIVSMKNVRKSLNFQNISEKTVSTTVSHQNVDLGSVPEGLDSDHSYCVSKRTRSHSGTNSTNIEIDKKRQSTDHMTRGTKSPGITERIHRSEKTRESHRTRSSNNQPVSSELDKSKIYSDHINAKSLEGHPEMNRSLLQGKDDLKRHRESPHSPSENSTPQRSRNSKECLQPETPNSRQKCPGKTLNSNEKIPARLTRNSVKVSSSPGLISGMESNKRKRPYRHMFDNIQGEISTSLASEQDPLGTCNKKTDSSICESNASAILSVANEPEILAVKNKKTPSDCVTVNSETDKNTRNKCGKWFKIKLQKPNKLVSLIKTKAHERSENLGSKLLRNKPLSATTKEDSTMLAASGANFNNSKNTSESENVTSDTLISEAKQKQKPSEKTGHSHLQEKKTSGFNKDCGISEDADSASMSSDQQCFKNNQAKYTTVSGGSLSHGMTSLNKDPASGENEIQEDANPSKDKTPISAKKGSTYSAKSSDAPKDRTDEVTSHTANKKSKSILASPVMRANNCKVRRFTKVESEYVSLQDANIKSASPKRSQPSESSSQNSSGNRLPTTEDKTSLSSKTHVSYGESENRMAQTENVISFPTATLKQPSSTGAISTRKRPSSKEIISTRNQPSLEVKSIQKEPSSTEDESTRKKQPTSPGAISTRKEPSSTGSMSTRKRSSSKEIISTRNQLSPEVKSMQKEPPSTEDKSTRKQPTSPGAISTRKEQSSTGSMSTRKRSSSKEIISTRNQPSPEVKSIQKEPPSTEDKSTRKQPTSPGAISTRKEQSSTGSMSTRKRSSSKEIISTRNQPSPEVKSIQKEPSSTEDKSTRKQPSSPGAISTRKEPSSTGSMSTRKRSSSKEIISTRNQPSLEVKSIQKEPSSTEDKSTRKQPSSTGTVSTRKENLSTEVKSIKKEPTSTEVTSTQKEPSATGIKSTRKHPSSSEVKTIQKESALPEVKSIQKAPTSTEVKSTRKQASSTGTISTRKHQSSAEAKSIQKKPSTEVKSTQKEPSSSEVKSTRKEPTSTEAKSMQKEPSSPEVTSTRNKPSSTEVKSIQKEASSTKVKSIQKEASSTEVKSTQKEPSSVEFISTLKQPSSTDVISKQKQPSSTEVISTQKESTSTDAISKQKQPSSTEVISTQKESTSTEGIATQKPTSSTEVKSTQKQPSSTEVISTQKHPSSTEGISTQKQTSSTEVKSTQKHPSSTEVTSTQKHPSSTEGISTQKPTSSTEVKSTQKQPSSTEVISTQKHPSSTEGISTQKHPSSTAVISDATTGNQRAVVIGPRQDPNEASKPAVEESKPDQNPDRRTENSQSNITQRNHPEKLTPKRSSRLQGKNPLTPKRYYDFFFPGLRKKPSPKTKDTGNAIPLPDTSINTTGMKSNDNKKQGQLEQTSDVTLPSSSDDCKSRALDKVHSPGTTRKDVCKPINETESSSNNGTQAPQCVQTGAKQVDKSGVLETSKRQLDDYAIGNVAEVSQSKVTDVVTEYLSDKLLKVENTNSCDPCLKAVNLSSTASKATVNFSERAVARELDDQTGRILYPDDKSVKKTKKPKLKKVKVKYLNKGDPTNKSNVSDVLETKASAKAQQIVKLQKGSPDGESLSKKKDEDCLSVKKGVKEKNTSKITKATPKTAKPLKLRFHRTSQGLAIVSSYLTEVERRTETSTAVSGQDKPLRNKSKGMNKGKRIKVFGRSGPNLDFFMNNETLQEHAFTLWKSETDWKIKKIHGDKSESQLEYIYKTSWTSLSRDEQKKYFSRAVAALTDENKHSPERFFCKLPLPVDLSSDQSRLANPTVEIQQPKAEEIERKLEEFHSMSVQKQHNLLRHNFTYVQRTLSKEKYAEFVAFIKTTLREQRAQNIEKQSHIRADIEQESRDIMFREVVRQRNALKEASLLAKAESDAMVSRQFEHFINQLISGEEVPFDPCARCPILRQTLVDLQDLEKSSRVSVSGEVSMSDSFITLVRDIELIGDNWARGPNKPDVLASGDFVLEPDVRVDEILRDLPALDEQSSLAEELLRENARQELKSLSISLLEGCLLADDSPGLVEVLESPENDHQTMMATLEEEAITAVESMKTGLQCCELNSPSCVLSSLLLMERNANSNRKSCSSQITNFT